MAADLARLAEQAPSEEQSPAAKPNAVKAQRVGDRLTPLTVASSQAASSKAEASDDPFVGLGRYARLLCSGGGGVDLAGPDVVLGLCLAQHLVEVGGGHGEVLGHGTLVVRVLG